MPDSPEAIREILSPQDSCYYVMFSEPVAVWPQFARFHPLKTERYYDDRRKAQCFFSLFRLNHEALEACLRLAAPCSWIISDQARYYFYFADGRLSQMTDVPSSHTPENYQKNFAFYYQSRRKKAEQYRGIERLIQKTGLETGIARAAAPCPRPGFRNYFYFAKESEYPLLFSLSKPKASGSGRKYPLLIYLHGAGANGVNSLRSIAEAAICFQPVLKRSSAQPCFLLAPQLPPMRYSSEQGGKPLADILAGLIARLIAQEPVDPNRIYLSGASAGGQGTWLSLYYHSELYAAAIPLMSGDENMDYSQIHPLPIWAGHSADDPICPVEVHDKTVEQARRAGCEVTYTRWENYGHQMSPRFYREEPWVDWLFSQRRTNIESAKEE